MADFGNSGDVRNSARAATTCPSGSWGITKLSDAGAHAKGITTYWGLPCHVCGKMIRLMEVDSGSVTKELVATPGSDPFVVYCPDCQSRQTVESIELMMFDGPLDLAFRSHPAFRKRY